MCLLRASAVSVLVVLALVVLPASVSTQIGSGVIEGRVTDTSGGVVPGADLVLTGAAISGQRRAVTDSQGAFRFIGLPPGRYKLEASLMGFKTVMQTLSLTAGQTATVKMVMEVGKLEERVTVGGRTEVVQTQTAATVRVRMAFQPWRFPSAPFRTTSFDKIDENPFMKVVNQPLSTFSIDVDTASYAYMRRSLTTGTLPPKDAIRIEELLNYFRYDYPDATDGAPFSVTGEARQCPWDPKHLLLHVGLQARRPESSEPLRRNLVFLLDVSGSMKPPDKLPLVRSAMSLLVNHLTARDTVAIVVYAGSSGLALPATRGDQQARIQAAIDSLRAGGSTNGAEGMELAYRLARENFIEGGVNRVILATDGDFNVGVTSRGDLMTFIEEKRKSGVYLSVLGVGDDNLKDGTMEQLADRGNGNYAYLDSLEEAQKVLVREVESTLIPVAGDVKIQVEFNPARVTAYRLIGYENRALGAEDFKDDRKDAGEMGAGQSVTALYEIVPAGAPIEARDVDPLRYQEQRKTSTAASSNEMAIVKLRYKRPGQDRSEPMDVTVRMPAGSSEPLGANLGFAAAVAAFGMVLRDSPYKGRATWQMAADLGRQHRGSDPDGYRAQFVRLVEMAEGLANAKRR